MDISNNFLKNTKEIKMFRSIFPLLIALIFAGCSTKQTVQTIWGPFSGTIMVHSKDDMPVSLFLNDNKDCFYEGYVKNYDTSTERFNIKINKQICQGSESNVTGLVYDENAMPGVESLKIGTKVNVYIMTGKISVDGENELKTNQRKEI